MAAPDSKSRLDQERLALRALARASSVLERSSSELSLAHYRVLSAIASGQERASQIAGKLALGRPAISAAVNSLTDRGLVIRSEVEGDQRASTLGLTAKGEHLLESVEAGMLDRMADLYRRTPDGERLIESLIWLGQAVDDRRAERHMSQDRPGARSGG
jgi:DNA-binding MarR family transcriptional regulator